MLLTPNQMKHLKQVDEKTFIAEVSDMNSDEKEKMKSFDELWYLSKGFHIIKNYDELD